MADIAGDSSTTAVVTVGSTTSGTLEVVGDHDWFKLELTAGQEIAITLTGVTLEDPYLRIRDASGNIIYENDDVSAGIIRDSKLSFTAPATGTYYIDVGAWNEDYTGTYELSVEHYTPPPVATYDEIADQLVNGYWGGDSHRFDVTQGGSITVNLTALTAEGQHLAREALALWSDIIGVSFVEVTSGGQITFDDNEEEAFSYSTWSGGIISSSHVNVSTQWLTDYGTDLFTYSFQTYVHEIGHALGLGHPGYYDGSSTYPYDALFANDAWSTSVMSYFDQEMNTYFADRNFTLGFAFTPMLADIVAMSQLYGLSTTTRTGDTTYGTYSNSDRRIHNAEYTQYGSVTIFDSGGIDTINYSGLPYDQRIDLRPATFSNVGGGIGNLTIAHGVLIENAMGGDGNDVLIGNGADNRLEGGPGNDRMEGAAGSDTVSYTQLYTGNGGVTVNLSLTGSQDTGAAGIDTLVSIENIWGSGANDTLTGNSGPNHIRGFGGDDRIAAGDGADLLNGSSGDDVLDGGAGVDTATYEDHYYGVVVDLSATGPQDTLNAGFDTLISIENLIGCDYSDSLTGNTAANRLDGLDGSDQLDGGAGADTMYGGLGDDTYFVDNSSDLTAEATGEGIDRVYSSVTHTLSANVENLILTGTANLYGTGNELDNVVAANAGSNRLFGLAGDDRLYGNGGSDTLDGGAGLDKMYGGLGDDTYIVSDTTDYTYELAGEGTDSVQASITHTLRDHVDNLVLTGSLNLYGAGNSAANTITGNAGANRLYGHGGDDRLNGGDGNDVLFGGAGVDNLYGGTGNDFYSVTDATDFVHENAGEGTDTVYAAISYVLVDNVERLYLVGGDAIDGTGSGSDNIIVGNGAANTVSGGAGNDSLYGNGGNDTLEGGAGTDKMYGGAGDDTYIVTDSTDHAYEAAGAGSDSVLASVSYSLRDNVETLTLTGSNAINGYGSGGANTMTGNDAVNVLAARAGDDAIFGLGGNDFLYGEDGNDTLVGGAGRDRHYGGAGSDTFAFADGDLGGSTTATADVVHDFSQAESDLLDLSAVDSDSSLSGDQGFTFVGTAAFSGVAGELRFEQTGGNTYVSGDTNGDGIADFMIRLDGTHTLTSGDFIF